MINLLVCCFIILYRMERHTWARKQSTGVSLCDWQDHPCFIGMLLVSCLFIHVEETAHQVSLGGNILCSKHSKTHQQNSYAMQYATLFVCYGNFFSQVSFCRHQTLDEEKVYKTGFKIIHLMQNIFYHKPQLVFQFQ